MASNSNNPLGEIFGFPVFNNSEHTLNFRSQKLCPFNNRVPNCTKDKASNPLGVCSINYNHMQVIICPIRFRQEWLIVKHAAAFFFPESTNWVSIAEARLPDAQMQNSGNVDYIIVAYDENGKITDFGSLEVQAVYISGNLRNPFDDFMQNQNPEFSWPTGYNYPKPDYLSSSRKRLVPQILYKGGIFKTWNKKQAVVLQKSFFDTLPELPVVEPADADIVWLLYDLKLNEATRSFELFLTKTIYTQFAAALSKIITPSPGRLDDFVSILQRKLDVKLSNLSDPDALGNVIIP